MIFYYSWGESVGIVLNMTVPPITQARAIRVENLVSQACKYGVVVQSGPESLE